MEPFSLNLGLARLSRDASCVAAHATNAILLWSPDERGTEDTYNGVQGDCTKQPTACFRCQAEDVVRVARLIRAALGEKTSGD